ncbi:hypothetical protein EVAR_74321_1 [Eumeta japonica]|uniref:Uncharacterized protein n=1 Tax=Eumeta variegata TaxID=151549 RepID=A0A4C1SD61_EUMVA|nr:hypothetical protein EVAR_74321_1 [Eumeta japonica]
MREKPVPEPAVGPQLLLASATELVSGFDRMKDALLRFTNFALQQRPDPDCERDAASAADSDGRTSERAGGRRV